MRALVIAAVLFGIAQQARADDVPWPTARAAELVEAGRAGELRGDVEGAVTRYRQAIEVDPTYGDAYLALGALRVATGDVEEGEKTYGAGIDHVLGFTAAYVARAELFRGEGKARAAIGDLSAAAVLAPNDAAILQRLCDAAVGAGEASRRPRRRAATGRGGARERRREG